MAKGRVILLSIKERWADAILAGDKAYEYRKQPPALDPPYRILLYATGGPSAVQGEAYIDDVITSVLPELLDRTISATPHPRADIRDYFGSDTGTALHITDVQPYDRPLSREHLETIIPDFHPPQNFRYINQDQFERIREDSHL